MQIPALQLLPAMTLVCIDAPLRGLHLRCGSNVPGCDIIDAAQLEPLAALCQLRSLEIRNLTDFGPGLLSALRGMTALTELVLAARPCANGAGSCGVFEAVAEASTRLQELRVVGHSNTHVARLPEGMSRLVRLRVLELMDVRVNHTSDVLKTLTALESLMIMRSRGRSPHEPQPQQNPLPAGMEALRSLRELRVACDAHPVPPLALPALEVLQLDEPVFGEQVTFIC